MAGINAKVLNGRLAHIADALEQGWQAVNAQDDPDPGKRDDCHLEASRLLKELQDDISTTAEMSA